MTTDHLRSVIAVSEAIHRHCAGSGDPLLDLAGHVDWLEQRVGPAGWTPNRSPSRTARKYDTAVRYLARAAVALGREELARRAGRVVEVNDVAANRPTRRSTPSG